MISESIQLFLVYHVPMTMPKNKSKLWYKNRCSELEHKIVQMENISNDIHLRSELQQLKELLKESIERESVLHLVIHSLRDNNSLPPSKMIKYSNVKIRSGVNR